MDTLPPEVAAWLANSTQVDADKPCGHYTGTRTCGATPTRHYIQGRRCHTHAPDQQKERQ